MPTTFQAIAVALFAILPGASYIFSYERVAGGFGVTLADRLVRFAAASAVFAALVSGPALLAYRNYVASGRLGHGDVPWGWFWLVALAYVVVPASLGGAVGGLQEHRPGLVRWLVGPAPEPRAWDYLWGRRRDGIVVAKLKSGGWVAGVYATNPMTKELSWAAGYPEPGDLYLSAQLVMDPDSGEFITEEDGAPVAVPGNVGILLRWNEIEYLTFQEVPSVEEGDHVADGIGVRKEGWLSKQSRSSWKASRGAKRPRWRRRNRAVKG